MKYELDTLEKLIETAFNPVALQGKDPVAETLNGAVRDLRLEKYRLRKAFMDASYECKEQYSFALYIHHHQQDLIRASNTIYRYQQNTAHPLLQTSYTQCMGCIEELLALMRYDFKDHANKLITVTHYYRDETAAMVKKYSTAQKKLWKQLNISERLQQIVLSVFEEYIEEEDCCSYQRYHYLQKLNASLLQSKDENSLIESLFAMNYNSFLFIKWYANNLTDRSQSNDKNESRKQILHTQLQENDQRMQLQDIALFPEEQSVKTAIRRHLEAETQCLQLQESAVTYKGINDKIPKIQLDLSVKEIACIIKLMEETGMIKYEFKKDIFEWVVTHCSSKEQTEISYGSLYKNYRDIEPATKKSVKNILLKLLNIVNRN